jgi:anhydro-N-acetylmuramic acid kinase
MSAELLHHHHRSYPPELRKQIFAFRGREDGIGGLTPAAIVRRLAVMGREIALTYAAAVNEALSAAAMNADQLTAVAAHGQTLFHDPPHTIQWFDPSLLAAEVGCAVVSDFRRADLAAGGQGAPLVPYADYVLFRNPIKDRVLLNIGGIANLTYLPAGGKVEEVIAFDTGPGNCIVDHLCRKFDPAGPGFDEGGSAARGGLDRNGLVDHLLRHHPYFRKPPPKSTDGPEMIAAFENAPLTTQPYVGGATVTEQGYADLLATACALTGRSIQKAMYDFLPKLPDEVIVSGGGIRNEALMDALRFEFRPTIVTADELGVSSAAKEAIAFALLGAATLDGEVGNVPSATGARRGVVLGSITPRP